MSEDTEYEVGQASPFYLVFESKGFFLSFTSRT